VLGIEIKFLIAKWYWSSAHYGREWWFVVSGEGCGLDLDAGSVPAAAGRDTVGAGGAAVHDVDAE